MFRKERIHVICNELKKLVAAETSEITEWQKKDGFFVRPEDCDQSETEWQLFDSKTMMWTGKDRHFWFRTTFCVPDSFAGKPLYLVIKTQIDEPNDMTNPQFLAFINGEPVQGVDMNHREICVTSCAQPGCKYVVDLQAYTGTMHVELMLIGQIVKVDEDILKFYHDLNVPLCIAEKLEDGNSAKLPLELALEKTIDQIDLRMPYSKEFYASLKIAEDYLQKAVYQDLANSNEVIATCIGHTHIDVAWLWTVSQTREKVARSFLTVLKLMDEYPEYKFMSSQPQLYVFLKERYPEIYKKVNQRVKEGRWEPEGGMWIEADCNLTSGESLVRQFLWGKRFFKEEFGVDNKILWLPDVFGYSAALPQIMKKCGIKYFMTTKIAWNEFNQFPNDTFWWYGIDGTPIFTHLVTTKGVDQEKDSFFTTYNGMLHPAALMGGWDRYQQKEINNDILVCYGHGDGGGGPTREMLETGSRLQAGIAGAPRVRQESSRTYFDELYAKLKNSPSVPRWVGELYLEYHRGTYTSMARNKRSNRKSELALMNLEMLSVWAEQYGAEYPKQEIDDMWRTVLLNQFHDILPGSSIKEVYDVTQKEYQLLEEKSSSLISERLHTLASAAGAGKNDVVAFNTLSANRNDRIVLEDTLGDATALIDDVEIYPLQRMENGNVTAWIKNIPSKGLKVLRLSYKKVETKPFFITKNGIETPYYKVRIDTKGFFTSIYDKRCKRELLAQGKRGNLLHVYEDKPRDFDDWNIDIYYSRKSWVADELTECVWVENGPVQAVLLTERHYCNSLIRQKIYFYSNSPRIDFETYVDWKEHQQLMKVEFPIDVNANEATYDIQFGNLTRPTHSNTSWDMAKFEVCAHKWADLSDGGYGVSLLNDCKYGYSIKNQTMALTLIKSGIDPNETSDQEEHYFTYAILPHEGNWKDANTAMEAYMLNLPVLSVHPIANAKAECEAIPSMLSIDCRNVIVETIKKTEDGKGVIVRAYENENRRTKVNIMFGREFKKVTECDLLENECGPVAKEARAFSFEINPYEIKTFRIIY